MTHDGSAAGTPNPRFLLAFLAVIMATQAVYAGIGIFGSSGDAGAPLRLILTAGFIVYAAMIVAFAIGLWQQVTWAWHLAVAIAVTGLALAVLRLAGGDAIEQHALGMVIDGALLFYLQRPSIRMLFGR